MADELSNPKRQARREGRDRRGKTPRPKPTQSRKLEPLRRRCVACGHRLWRDETKHRTVGTLEGVVGLEVHLKVCPNRSGGRTNRPVHPEEEGAGVLPHYSYALDVLALVGALRYREHQSVPPRSTPRCARGA